MRADTHLTGIQTEFARNLLIVSKTDPNGVITYANHGFCEVACYRMEELLGRPHSIVRHPDMPRTAFSVMWETLKSGQEFFAYVVNRAANGNHYWVFAHVVPDVDPRSGAILGYHSARRWADPQACERAMAVYQVLLDVERREPTPRRAVEAGRAALATILNDAGHTYEKWVFSLAE